MTTTLSDGKTTVKLPLNPEKFITSIQGEYAANSVLDTDNPDTRRKYSTRTYKMGRVLLASSSGVVDFSATVKQLEQWARSQTALKLTSDLYNLKLCHIKDLTVDIRLWKGSKVLLAELELSLIEGRIAAMTSAAKPTTKKLTPAGQARAKDRIDKKLKAPTKQKLLSLTSTPTVTVSDLAMVTLSADGVDTEYNLDDLEQKLT